ncbi:MAG: hypothetical protein JRN15_10920 [Nitrososphaerota archaeon]|nr:hypothetical protein [Nitrososphaerota archaeon]
MTTRRNLMESSHIETIADLERRAREAAGRMSMRIELRSQHAKTGRFTRQQGPDKRVYLVPANYSHYPIRRKDIDDGTCQIVGEYYGLSMGLRSRYAACLRLVIQMEELQSINQ